MVGGISGAGSFGLGAAGAFYQSRLAENIRNARGARQAEQGQAWAARKSPSLETPVEPVRAVRPISRDEASLPELASRLENDPAAMAGRMRTRYGEVTPEGLFVETGKESLSPVQGSRKNALEGQLFQAEEALGSLDALVCSAGIALPIQLLTDNHYTVDEANDVVHEKNNVVAAGLVFKVERIGDYS